MKIALRAAVAASIMNGLLFSWSAHAQSGTSIEITYSYDLETRARDQLRGILSQYDLDPWIFTQKVRIEAGQEPHSMPMLTLNTDFLDDDTMQLSVFLHEQIHWFLDRAQGRDAAIEDLRTRYPDAPRSDVRTYQHVLVAWLELDAMAQLIGEQKARRNLEAKVQRLVAEVSPEVGEIYAWYNTQALEDTEEIGKIVATHGMNITPQKGIVVGTRER